MKFKIITIILFTTILFISCSESKRSENNNSGLNEPTYELDDRFLTDYQNNRVGADNKYLEKTFNIKGTITDFSNFGGEPVVNVYVSDVDGTAVCHFEASKSEEIGNLQRGQKVVIRGVFTSMITSLDFSNCEIKEVRPRENE